jgi:hypothetical protein
MSLPTTIRFIQRFGSRQVELNSLVAFIVRHPLRSKLRVIRARLLHLSRAPQARIFQINRIKQLL